jgi:hypothetical protein
MGESRFSRFYLYTKKVGRGRVLRTERRIMNTSFAGGTVVNLIHEDHDDDDNEAYENNCRLLSSVFILKTLMGSKNFSDYYEF